MRLRELYTTIIFEGVADVIKRLKATYPDQVAYIDEHAKWIRETFPKGAEWYMLIIGDHMSGNQDKLAKRLGMFPVFEFNKLQPILQHYSTLDYQPIKDYAFNAKTVQVVLAELQDLEAKWKKLPSRPVRAQEGDYLVQDFGNGFQWWFVDRGYCEEEGRSGKHCGNVVGREKRDQRILSFRKDMKVLLTFILLPNGFLGEMKAAGNQKPDPKYHPYIMYLLLSNIVKGIKGAGFLPEFNFSVFDLDENNINTLIQSGKSNLIGNQIKATPREILRAPAFIRDNQEYQQIAIRQDNNLSHFFVNGKMDNSIEAWERAIAANIRYVIHAPAEVKDYREKVIRVLTSSPNLLMECPRSIIKDEPLITEMVETNYRIFENLPPAGMTPSLCKKVLSNAGGLLKYVPEAMKTPELCKIAVEQDGYALSEVPEELKTLELVHLATKTKTSWEYIPEKFHTPEIARAVVEKNGWTLEKLPKSFITPELCTLAVATTPKAVSFVPPEMQTPELLKHAVTTNGRSIEFIPKEAITPELIELALPTNGEALRLMPEGSITEKMCYAALSDEDSYGKALQHVPEQFLSTELITSCIGKYGTGLQYLPNKFKTPEICKLAVERSAFAISSVPPSFLTPELCKMAVSHTGYLLGFIPYDFKTPEICEIAIKDSGHALENTPEELRTPKLCKMAIESEPIALHAIPYNILTNPDLYFELCKLAITKANKRAMETNQLDENYGTPLQLLEDSPFRHYLSQEQKQALLNMVHIMPEYDNDDDNGGDDNDDE